jgi:peptidoglycan/LPS O-acetylase OafA/YrhL
MTSVAKSRHMPALDGVRGIAILLVIAFHLPRVTQLFDSGWIGVDLFFVLSGFLITGVLIDGAGQPHRARVFYARRALRILPLYYLALVVALVLMPHVPHAPEDDPHRLVANQVWLWTYTANWPEATQSFKVSEPLPFLGPFWSLAIEEQFYLIWPWIVWHCSRRVAQRIAWGVVIASPVVRLVLALAGVSAQLTYFLTPFRLDGLAVGALLAFAVHAPRDSARADHWVRRAGLAGLIVLVGVIVRWGGLSSANPVMRTIGLSALAGVFGWLVMVAAVRPPAVLRAPILVHAGRYSYGLYVIHPFVISVLHTWRGYGGLRSVVAVVTISVALAYVSYVGYEQRFLKLKDRLAPY